MPLPEATLGRFASGTSRMRTPALSSRPTAYGFNDAGRSLPGASVTMRRVRCVDPAAAGAAAQATRPAATTNRSKCLIDKILSMSSRRPRGLRLTTDYDSIALYGWVVHSLLSYSDSYRAAAPSAV